MGIFTVAEVRALLPAQMHDGLYEVLASFPLNSKRYLAHKPFHDEQRKFAI